MNLTYRVIKTLLYTGVRVSELANIRLEDVDLERSQIWINTGTEGKERTVQFPVSFKEVLAMHIDNMERKQADYLFESNHLRSNNDSITLKYQGFSHFTYLLNLLF
jgi:integrase/recombinase XerD